MKKTALILAVLSTFLLAACQNDNTNNNSTAPANTTVVALTTAANAETTIAAENSAAPVAPTDVTTAAPSNVTTVAPEMPQATDSIGTSTAETTVAGSNDQLFTAADFAPILEAYDEGINVRIMGMAPYGDAAMKMNTAINRQVVEEYNDWLYDDDHEHSGIDIMSYIKTTNRTFTIINTVLEYPTYGDSGEFYAFNYSIKDGAYVKLEDRLRADNLTENQVEKMARDAFAAQYPEDRFIDADLEGFVFGTVGESSDTIVYSEYFFNIEVEHSGADEERGFFSLTYGDNSNYAPEKKPSVFKRVFTEDLEKYNNI
jgi:hypothetical protein